MVNSLTVAPELGKFNRQNLVVSSCTSTQRNETLMNCITTPCMDVKTIGIPPCTGTPGQPPKFGCVLVYRYTKEQNINELRHNSMYGYENNRNSPVYRYTRKAPKILFGVLGSTFKVCSLITKSVLRNPVEDRSMIILPSTMILIEEFTHSHYIVKGTSLTIYYLLFI